MKFGEDIEREYRLIELLRRPTVTYLGLKDLAFADLAVQVEENVAAQVEIQAKYAGYITKQEQEVAHSKQAEQTAIPAGVDYDAVSGLSNEVREKLKATRPTTLGQASRIPGVTPAAVSLLRVFLKRGGCC